MPQSKSAIHLQGDVEDRGSLANELIDWGFGTFLGMQGELAILKAIKERKTDANILLRYYNPSIMGLLPKERAHEFYHYLTTPQQEGIIPIEITNRFIPVNELNLAIEHQGEGKTQTYWESEAGYKHVDWWLSEMILELRKLLPEVILLGDCDSPGHGPLVDENGTPIPEGPYEGEMFWKRHSLKEWDEHAFHCYGEALNQWYGMRWARFINTTEVLGIKKKTWITEYNCPDTKRDFMKLLELIDSESDIEAATWFLWASPDPSFMTMQMCHYHTHYLPLLQQYAATHTGEEAPPMTDDGKLYETWVSQGGDRTKEGFMKFLGPPPDGIGKPDYEDVEKYGYPSGSSCACCAGLEQRISDLEDNVAELRAAAGATGDTYAPFRGDG